MLAHSCGLFLPRSFFFPHLANLANFDGLRIESPLFEVAGFLHRFLFRFEETGTTVIENLIHASPFPQIKPAAVTVAKFDVAFPHVAARYGIGSLDAFGFVNFPFGTHEAVDVPTTGGAIEPDLDPLLPDIPRHEFGSFGVKFLFESLKPFHDGVVVL